MPGIDFSKFHTYKWVTVDGAKYPNQIVDAQIKQAIDSQLAAKGLTKVDNGPADLYISLSGRGAAVRRNGMHTGPGGYRWGGGMACCDTIDDQYRHSCARFL